MTDRYMALTVVLENDIREDDAEPLIAAIQQLRGVLSVTGFAADISQHIAQQRITHELRKKILEALK